jgi:hypothetical protein
VDDDGVVRGSDEASLGSELVDEASNFKGGVIVLFDMVTVPAGVPSIRSGWLDGPRVIRKADPGGTETFMSDKIKSAGEEKVFGRLTRMVFLPAELDP